MATGATVRIRGLAKRPDLIIIIIIRRRRRRIITQIRCSIIQIVIVIIMVTTVMRRRPDLNGAVGRVDGFDAAEGRWMVTVDGAGGPAKVRVRPTNLEVLPERGEEEPSPARLAAELAAAGAASSAFLARCCSSLEE